MSGLRQNTQRELARELVETGEALIAGDPGVEPVVAGKEPESPATTTHLIEEVCERENLVRAWQRVRGNKGAPGVDGMTIGVAKSYLREHWPNMRSQLLAGSLVLRAFLSLMAQIRASYPDETKLTLLTFD